MGAEATDTRAPAEADTSTRWLVLLGVWLIYFAFGICVASMAPLVGPIARELGVGNGVMGAILGAWPLLYVASAIPGGILLDRFGARRMLFCAALIMAASLGARSLAETPVQMFLAVALFGIGGPLISVGAPKTITGLFTGKARASAMGIYVTGPYLGGILAMALTNSVAMPLVDNAWRSVLQLYGAFMLTCGAIWLVISHRAARRGPSCQLAKCGASFDTPRLAAACRESHEVSSAGAPQIHNDWSLRGDGLEQRVDVL